MPLDTILQALETEAERLVAEIDQATQAEVECIRAQAQAEAVAVRQKHITAVEAPLRAEQARILNRAKLEALQKVLGTREELITAVLNAAARRLAALPATEAYAGVLRQLTQEAAEALGVNRVCLRVQSRDLALMNRIVQELGLPATVTGGLENEEAATGELGGVIATSPDGRISLVNTPAARLKQVASLHRAQIAELIFGDQQED
ncbi:MAG: V-type ATP synthase subunit E family protein [Chloroflexota bacterium]